jgi:hypothetical protein
MVQVEVEYIMVALVYAATCGGWGTGTGCRMRGWDVPGGKWYCDWICFVPSRTCPWCSWALEAACSSWVAGTGLEWTLWRKNWFQYSAYGEWFTSQQLLQHLGNLWVLLESNCEEVRQVAKGQDAPGRHWLSIVL